jgi:hypothetical protein
MLEEQRIVGKSSESRKWKKPESLVLTVSVDDDKIKMSYFITIKEKENNLITVYIN